jgi:cation/acetate symporter
VVALPLGVLGAVLGTLIAGRNDAHERRFDEVMLRVHTGVRS